MSRPATLSGKPTLGGQIITQFLAVLVCVLVPAAVTAIAPVSWIKLQRQGDHVTARAETCLLFFIPFRSVTVDPMTTVSQREVSGTYTRHIRRGTDHYTQSEDEGFVSLVGPKSEVQVPVTPHDIDAVTRELDAFLKDPHSTKLSKFVVANWKFSIGAGGLVSLLTVLYVGSIAAGIIQFLLRLLGIGRKPAAR